MLKKTLFSLLALLSFGLTVRAQTTSASTAVAAPENMQLFLLIGQSNMAGRAPVEPEDKVPHPRVFMLTKELTWVPATDPVHFDKPKIAGVGPASSFARALADRDPQAIIGLIPAAFGGTSLEEWKPGGKLYADAVARTREALKRGKLAGILWHQGEADSAPAKATTYTERFNAMITQLRADLGAPDVPVIVGETGRFRAGAEQINAVLAALPAHVSHCGFASAEGLSDKGDHLHFNRASQHEFGRRYATAWFALAGLPAAAPSLGMPRAGKPPVVIFKLDDLRDTEKARHGFSRVFDVLVAKNIHAGFGIIADSCEDNGNKTSYYDLVRRWAASGRVEIWHHGYDHVQGEFSDGNYARQVEHLQKANRLVAEKCGVTLRSFGAPFNANDAATVRALNDTPQLAVWMFSNNSVGAKQRLLTIRCNMEPKTGVVSYDLFVKDYAAHVGAAYIVVQGHPPYWDDASHAAFTRIVDFCRAQRCAFATPYECAQAAPR